MFHERNFSSDHEFSKLLVRDSDVDLTIVSLEIAHDAKPNLSFDETLAWIAARGDELSGPIAAAWSEADSLRALCSLLAETHGIRGDAEAYQVAESSYLPDVIAGQRGIPISLSILYMAVARAAGIALNAVAAPQHFLTRFDGIDGTLFIDAFGGGHIMARAECLEFLKGVTGISGIRTQTVSQAGRRASGRDPDAQQFESIACERDDWAAAWRVQERLVALKPGSYEERRDLAFVALKCERTRDALQMLEVCLSECPEDQKELLQQHLEEARRQLAKWN